LFASQADTNATGDGSTRVAKTSLRTRCRWVSGLGVTTSSTSLGGIRTTCFVNDSTTATGIDASWILNNPPAGKITIGITLEAVRAPATYGSVQILTDDGGRLSVEDIGRAV
jgi:hypothetical protein